MNERERIIEYWRKRARECLLAAFNKEFVKTGKVDKELGKFYNRMFEHRRTGDYGELVEFEEEDVKGWLRKAEEFLDTVEKL